MSTAVLKEVPSERRAGTLTLAQRMIAARNSVGVVTKRGDNTKQNYKFVKATDVAAEVRSALFTHGIDFDFTVLEERTWESPTNSGGRMYFCSLRVGATFTDCETGENKLVFGIGWGSDTLDKAPYKAMTGALKYILRMNFLIPDEEDPERDNSHYDEVQQSGQAAAHKQESPKGETLIGTVMGLSFSGTGDDELVWFLVKVGDEEKRIYRKKSLCSPNLYKKEKDSDAYKIEGEAWEFSVEEPETTAGGKLVHKLSMASPVRGGKK
jgi:hypothetical protein